MKVAALVHFSVPWRNCGSETVLQELMEAAVRAGHEATVWCTHETAERMWRGNEPDEELNGVKLVRVRNPLVAQKEIGRWLPDVIVTHHQHATLAIRTARLLRARSVFLTHNNFGINGRPLRMKPDLVVFNSSWVGESLTKQFGKPKASMTFHPPLTPDRHMVERTGDALTLINLNKDKGAETFYQLAQRLPERRFLGVVGGHGRQIIRRMPNVQIMEHGPDMKRVWSATRVLLMPSVQESYGLTAVEAGLNGIPTIAHPTAGLRENLGGGGLFADRDKPREWERHIYALDGPMEYAEASDYARTLADDAVTATRHTLKTWVEWLA